MRPPRRHLHAIDAGFTLVEIIVVVVIISILMAVALPTLKNTNQNAHRPAWVSAGSTIWHGVESYRVDNHGELPPTGQMANGGASFVTFDGGQHYVQHWPNSPTDGKPIVVTAAGGATPPLTGPKESILYAIGGNKLSGWMAVYDGNGRIAMRRVVLPSTGAPLAPFG